MIAQPTPRRSRTPDAPRRARPRLGFALALHLALVPVLVLAPAAGRARAQAPAQPGAALNPEIKALVDGGVAHLSQNTNRGFSSIGYSALSALALSKAGRPVNDPVIVSFLRGVDGQFQASVYQPIDRSAVGIYTAGVTLMALASIAGDDRKEQIQIIANWIVGVQKGNGSWDYENRTAGDTSVSQYALLGLWEAATAGAQIPPSTWDRAASWFLSVQAPGGSWNYHRDESALYPETISMTAAGVGSLLICKQQLREYRERRATVLVSNLLTPVGEPPKREAGRYEISTSMAALDAAVERGIAWMSRNLIPTDKDKSRFYGIYGIERVGALLGSETIGARRWFDEGVALLRERREAGGFWNAEYSDIANTAWAVLFLTRSTGQTVQKIKEKQLGAGMLLGGRGLPTDLNAFTIAQGRVVVKPMSGAIEGMLEILEDPRAMNAETAVAGMMELYKKNGPRVLRPIKDRLAKLLRDDSDPGVRLIAAWALAHTEDLDVVPELARALKDPVPEVVAQARDGLRLISRKIQGYGPEDGAPLEERERAAERWLEWYRLAAAGRDAGS